MPRDPVKQRARLATRKAVGEGRLVRLPCQVCGVEPAQAHHEDYTKPLEVIWLCRTHHHELHRLRELPCSVCQKPEKKLRKGRCRRCYYHFHTYGDDRDEYEIALSLVPETGRCAKCGGEVVHIRRRWLCRSCRAADERERRAKARR